MDISRMKKHTGIINNTGARCIVVFREVPDDKTNCLVVETDRLPDMYHDNIIEIVNSAESQKTNDFFEVLNRRTFSDGLNGLQALHYKGLLRKIPTDQISLVPFPGQALPLDMLNAQISGTTDEYNAAEAVKEEKKVESFRKDNPMSDPNDPKALALGLIVQAELLEAEAKKKRAEALELDPETVPATKKKRGRPELSAEDKAVKAEERKVKRRERDRAKAAAKKAEKIQAQVDAKVMRDAAM